MTGKNGKIIKSTAGAVVAALVVGAGYLGFQLRRWATAWDRAAEKGAAYADPNSEVAPQLLTWHEVGRIKTGLASVKSFALLKDGSLVVAGESKLRLLSSQGPVVRDIALDGMPQSVAVMETPTGPELFAGLKDHVEVYDCAGKPLGKWPSLGGDAFLTCLTPGASGKTLWVADAGQRIVEELDMSGKVLRQVGGEDSNTHAPGLIVPSAHLDVVVAGPDGSVWINNPGRHELEEYDGQGRLVRQWGMAGTDIGQFSGCCNPTDFFRFADGRTVTSEKGTPRVKVFDANGVLQSVITTDFFSTAAGIDVAGDNAGRVWVLDPIEHELRIYAPKAGALAGNL